jgi:hypothetical protein
MALLKSHLRCTHANQTETTLTKAAAPDLVAAFGIGPDIAAEMLMTAATTTIASVRTPR